MDSSARRRPDRNAGPNAYHEDEVTVLTGPSKSAGIGWIYFILFFKFKISF
jgi:hypothetical protein